MFNFVLNYTSPLPSTTTLDGQILKQFLSYTWVNMVTEVPTFPVTLVGRYLKQLCCLSNHKITHKNCSELYSCHL